MLIVLSPLFVQLMHTNYYKIVKQLKIIYIYMCVCVCVCGPPVRGLGEVLKTTRFSIVNFLK